MTGRGYYHNTKFINWKHQTKSCGAKQKTFGPWKGNSDMVAYAEFKNTIFDNVHDSAITFFNKPKESWKNPDDCGPW